MKFRRIPRLRIPANERFRLQESPGYNDRLQFCAFVCDKASAPGGLNKFHNTLHFDPRWIIRASAYLFTRDTCAPLYTAREFIKLSRAPLCRSSCTARAPYKYRGQLFFFRKDFPQIFRIFSPFGFETLTPWMLARKDRLFYTTYSSLFHLPRFFEKILHKFFTFPCSWWRRNTHEITVDMLSRADRQFFIFLSWLNRWNFNPDA